MSYRDRLGPTLRVPVVAILIAAGLLIGNLPLRVASLSERISPPSPISNDGAPAVSTVSSAAEITGLTAFQRAERALGERGSPVGRIPEEALSLAYKEVQRTPVDVSPSSGKVWVNVGPASVQSPYGPYSGSVADIAGVPGDPNHWFIGTAYGGVWETRDAGLTWAPKTDDQSSLSIGALAIAPSNPNVMYAGTGAYDPGYYAGAGVLRSTDGGATWESLASDLFFGAIFTGMEVDSKNATVLIATTTQGYHSYNSFVPNIPLRGIHTSTDGGAHWTRRLSGDASDIQADPSDFRRQYAGIGSLSTLNVNSGLYRSNDSGTTWSLINGPWKSGGPIGVAIAPANHDIVYVSVLRLGFVPGDVNSFGQLIGIWRTDNAWASAPSWTQIPNPDSQPRWDPKIAVDPTNSNILYAGGILLWKFDGSQWTDIRQNLHVDKHALAWVGNRLIVGNDGGVYSTTDGGVTWNNHNTNLSTILFYRGSVHPTNPYIAIGGSQDNGLEIWNGSDAWRLIEFGDGGASEFSSRNPDKDWVVSFFYFQIYRTTDGGISYVPVNLGIDSGGAPFVTDFEKCPANDDVFITGTNNLWKSTDFFSSTVPSWGSNGPEMSASITAMAFGASDATCNTYAYGTSAGQLYGTVDGGATWMNLDAGNRVPNHWVTSLAFDPRRADILFATLAGFNSPQNPAVDHGHVFKTRNALAPTPIWSDVSPPADLPFDAIVLDSSDPGKVIVGTDFGIWTSADCGGTWTHEGPETGMPNVPVFDLHIRSDGTLMAFTQGRGAFTRTADPTNLTLCAPENLRAFAGNRKVDLVWEDPSFDGGAPITGYRIYRGTSSGGESLLTSTGNVLAYSDPGLQNGVRYVYQVSAITTAGEGPRSREANATPATTPSAPGNLHGVAGNGYTRLGWQAPADNGGAPITNYEVYRGTTAGTLSLVATLDDVVEYGESGLTNGATYYYQVAAGNVMGTGPMSNEVSLTPFEDTTSPSVTIVSPTEGSTVTSRSITVSGRASDNVMVQKVEISTDESRWMLATGTASWSGPAFLVLGNNTIYVRATDTSGNVAGANVTVRYTPLSPLTIFGPFLVLGSVTCIGVGILVALVVVVVYRSRRRRRRGAASVAIRMESLRLKTNVSVLTK